MNFKLYKAGKNNNEEANNEDKTNLLTNKWILQKIGNETIDTTKYSQRISTLEFQQDGSDSHRARSFGYGGCNRFSDTITITENNITFDNFISTKMACTGPDIETRYLKLLPGIPLLIKQMESCYTLKEGKRWWCLGREGDSAKRYISNYNIL